MGASIATVISMIPKLPSCRPKFAKLSSLQLLSQCLTSPTLSVEKSVDLLSFNV